MKGKNRDLEYYLKLPYHILIGREDEGDGPYWVARVVELPHCLIHGNSPEEAIREIEEVKKEWIKSCLERGIKIPEPIPDLEKFLAATVEKAREMIKGYQEMAEENNRFAEEAFPLAREVIQKQNS